ncbi:hypothetical protein XENOCAPTIV_026182, partial [Xenoophorus captivus]
TSLPDINNVLSWNENLKLLGINGGPPPPRGPSHINVVSLCSENRVMSSVKSESMCTKTNNHQCHILYLLLSLKTQLFGVLDAELFVAGSRLLARKMLLVMGCFHSQQAGGLCGTMGRSQVQICMDTVIFKRTEKNVII